MYPGIADGGQDLRLAHFAWRLKARVCAMASRIWRAKAWETARFLRIKIL
jgi:hypothetical protein